MRLITVNAYQVGLVFKNGVYLRMLTEGRHWLSFKETAIIYEKDKPFSFVIELTVLLKDPALAEALHIVEVKDNSIALVYENGLLARVLNAGRYAFWKGMVTYDFVHADIGKVEITENISRNTLTSPLVAPYVRTSAVEAHEKGILFVDGKFHSILMGGVYFFWKNNIPVSVAKVDTRVLQLEVNGQEILTRDKTALRINAWARYQVVDIEKALLQNKEYERQLYVAFQLALREYTAGFSFDELLEKKDLIGPYILERVGQEAASLGVQIAGFGIRDIILPGEVRDIMNQVLVAEKKAQANLIMRREETASTRSLLNTAKLMEDNPMLFRLKEMEYVEKIAEKVNNISLSGNGALIDQLRQIFGTPK
ncbi:MAG: slipin family protein [Bacteroidetes bacterium]|nr:slipin family protein [Bacteroidota bacterium]